MVLLGTAKQHGAHQVFILLTLTLNNTAFPPYVLRLRECGGGFVPRAPTSAPAFWNLCSEPSDMHPCHRVSCGPLDGRLPLSPPPSSLCASVNPSLCLPLTQLGAVVLERLLLSSFWSSQPFHAVWLEALA